MPNDTQADLTERARALAFAYYIYAVRESGVMAANPDMLRENDAFDRSWNGSDATAEAMREHWEYVARTADRVIQSAREAAAAEARRATIEECAKYAENQDHMNSFHVAIGIRALASPPAPQEDKR